MINRTSRTAFTLALLLALGPLAERLTAEPARAFTSHHAALVESGLDLTAPIFLEPLSYGDGVATYRFREAYTGREAEAKVRVVVDPLRHGRPAAYPGVVLEEKASRKALTFNGASNRCAVTFYLNINLSNGFLVSNLDINDWGGLGRAYNDEVSSISTECSAAYIFEHEQWAGAGLYVPPSSSIANLGTFNLNDKLSSHYVVCP